MAYPHNSFTQNELPKMPMPETPIIARLHEVSFTRELTSDMYGDPDQAVMDRNAPPSDTETSERYRAPGKANEIGVLPFVGKILRYLPGDAITVERRLTTEEDLYLADHHFVHAPGIKPLSACFPVVPMTASLEIMAQTAACLAPGYGLIGFENVTAARWIALEDTDALTLRVEAHIEHFDTLRDTWRIGVAVSVEGEPRPSISAQLLFARHYQLGLSLVFEELVTDSRLSAAQLYAQRQLFHGPRFQCLSGSVLVGAQGAAAELLVRAPDNLFRSTRTPQLLTDPALMDTIGQVMAVWSMQQQERAALPIGIGKLEFYGPTPEPGTRIPMRVRITGTNNLRIMSADVEIEDGAGNVWLRIKDWKSWQFQWHKRLVDFRRFPTRYLLSDTLQLPASTPGPLCQRLTAERIAGFDLALLARHYLHIDEMAAFSAKSNTLPRQRQWLLGRIAAKDAVRAWAASQTDSEEMLHPATFAIDNDDNGRPFVSGWPETGLPVPEVSIAHCEDQAIAAAHGKPVGIDIERIAERDADFLKAISSEPERELLAAFSGTARQEWITRLWCAKETLGKLMGTGVNEAPQRFEAQTLCAGDRLLMRHRGSGRQTLVTTVHDGDFMIAVGLDQVSHA